MELKYANQFQVEEYSNCKLITIVTGGRFLLIPKGVSVPKDVPSDIVVLQQPLKNVYLVSSAVMDLVSKAGALSHISFTGTKEKDWYVQEAADAMKAGALIYAGKYSAPDYELLLSNNCQFVIENTMITHNPEVKEKIQKIALELGYKPNLIGQALVRSKQDFKLGVILQSTETPTMQIVRAGVQRAAEELAASGVELVLRDFQGLDTELMLEYIEELVSAGVQGIALSPDTAPEVRQCIDELHAQGIPVITLNADAPGSKRLCFIGMDNYRAGQTAACLLRLMLPEGGKVLPLAGHLNNTAHNNRLNGFLDAIKAENTLNISTLVFQPCFDRDDYSHEITQHALRANPDLAAIYVASNGQKGVCQAIEEEGLKGRVKVAAFDLNELNMELLQSDSLSFVLDQEAFEQGYRPPFLLYEYLLHKKKPEKELLYTDIAIRTKYNSDMALVCTTMQSGL